MNNIDFHATQLPVKTKVKTIQFNIQEGEDELKDNQKELLECRNEVLTLKNTVLDDLKTVQEEILEKVNKVQTDLNRISKTDFDDTSNLKKQTLGLNQEKVKLQKNIIALNQRIKQVEDDIGYE